MEKEKPSETFHSISLIEELQRKFHENKLNSSDFIDALRSLKEANQKGPGFSQDEPEFRARPFLSSVPEFHLVNIFVAELMIRKIQAEKFRVKTRLAQTQIHSKVLKKNMKARGSALRGETEELTRAENRSTDLQVKEKSLKIATKEIKRWVTPSLKFLSDLPEPFNSVLSWIINALSIIKAHKDENSPQEGEESGKAEQLWTQGFIVGLQGLMSALILHKSREFAVCALLCSGEILMVVLSHLQEVLEVKEKKIQSWKKSLSKKGSGVSQREISQQINKANLEQVRVNLDRLHLEKCQKEELKRIDELRSGHFPNCLMCQKVSEIQFRAKVLDVHLAGIFRMCSDEQVFQSIDFKSGMLRRATGDQSSLQSISTTKSRAEEKGTRPGRKTEQTTEETKEKSGDSLKKEEPKEEDEEEGLEDFSFDLENLSEREIHLLNFLLPGVIEQNNEELLNGVLKVARNIEKQFKMKVLGVMERERELIERTMRFEQQEKENQNDIEFVQNLSTVDLDVFPKHTMEELVDSARSLKTKYYPMIIELLEKESGKVEISKNN